MKGETPIYIEAGFPYVDAGAKATDTLDGDLTDFITKDGDTVNDANAFHSARSCREILKAAVSHTTTTLAPPERRWYHTAARLVSVPRSASRWWISRARKLRATSSSRNTRSISLQTSIVPPVSQQSRRPRTCAAQMTSWAPACMRSTKTML